VDLSELVAMEARVWEALRTGDAAADVALLSPDFLGVYPSGFATRSDHAGELVDGPTVSEYSIHDARLLVVAEGHVMLSYRAMSRRAPDAEPEAQYISSLWSRREGRWLNVFSQDTPVA
jgi:hypothetical protein